MSGDEPTTEDSILKIKVALLLWGFMGFGTFFLAINFMNQPYPAEAAFDAFSVACVAQAAVGFYAAGVAGDQRKGVDLTNIGFAIAAINSIAIGLGWMTVYGLSHIVVH